MIALALLTAGLAAGDSARTDSTRVLTTPPWWEASLVASAESFSTRLRPWQWHTAALRYRGRAASHAVEVFSARRHGLTDRGVAVEETRTLGPRAYFALRAQLAPGADVVARTDLSAEVYRSIGSGWEVAPSARLMAYENETIPSLSLGLGRYVGPWYLRGRVTGARLSETNGLTTSASARRYLAGVTSNFVEASVAVGNEVTTLSPTVVDLRRTNDAAVRGQMMLTHGLGMSLGVSYSTNESLPDRRGASLGAFVRW